MLSPFSYFTKGKVLIESLKKSCNTFFAQDSDFELQMAEPFANERKKTLGLNPDE